MTEPTKKVWLIGMNNPYSDDPEDALLPYPKNSAGWRLCRLIFGMRRRQYIDAFERRNLLSQDRWSAPAARESADRLRGEVKAGDRIILLGRQVCEAWFPKSWAGPLPRLRERVAFSTACSFPSAGVLGDPDYYDTLVLPHPSGLNRAWNDPEVIPRAREALYKLAPWLQPPEWLTSDPKYLDGAQCVRGRTELRALAFLIREGGDEAYILSMFPWMSVEDLRAATEYIRKVENLS